MLQGQALTKSYGSVTVLKKVDIQVQPGEIVSIVGSSGAGKSTLLHILGTLERPDAGNVYVNGVLLNSLNAKQLNAFRNTTMGFVFQFHHLLPEFSALENVCIPGWIAKTSKQQVTARATELLQLVGLGDRLQHKPAMLSGGEQQRVAVARALINQPKIVFADEPTGNLDTANAHYMHELFVSLQQQFNQTFLIVTHNQELASVSNRVLTMKDGEII
ncbi:MAG: ABC transporter ATP-binding protein [Bacteroidetes bacterium]|nr:MAG: ABC transporter ATP-binding protein [Bacteroidota bacterium]TAF93037.1 MAG: ABC transporter ATP-binding protein [Bacteroidota bacterium]